MSSEHYKNAVKFKQALDEWKGTAEQLLEELKKSPDEYSLDRVVGLLKANWVDARWALGFVWGDHL